MLLRLALILGLMTQSVNAEVGTDKFAHLGVSYALNMTFYGIFKKGMHLESDERLGALVMSIPIVFMMGLAKEALDCDAQYYRYNGKCNFDMGDMGANLVGIGLSSLTIFVFDF